MISISQNNLNTHPLIVGFYLGISMYRTVTGLKLLLGASSSYYNTIRGEVCFLGPRQHMEPVSTSSLPDLAYSNIKNLNVSVSNYANSYVPPLVSDS
jgi:hypothetical protein